jgi:hypothetical protein
MEMPAQDFFNIGAIQAALGSGQLSQADIDNSVLRILVPMFRQGLFDTVYPDGAGQPSVPASSPPPAWRRHIHLRLARSHR